MLLLMCLAAFGCQSERERREDERYLRAQKAQQEQILREEARYQAQKAILESFSESQAKLEKQRKERQRKQEREREKALLQEAQFTRCCTDCAKPLRIKWEEFLEHQKVKAKHQWQKECYLTYSRCDYEVAKAEYAAYLNARDACDKECGVECDYYY